MSDDLLLGENVGSELRALIVVRSAIVLAILLNFAITTGTTPVPFLVDGIARLLHVSRTGGAQWRCQLVVVSFWRGAYLCTLS